MPDRFVIRDSTAGDVGSIDRLYPAAFPDEDLLPLVRELVSGDHDVLSLVGLVDGALAAHAVFTVCGVAGARTKVALLGPLAVAPAHQRQGLGRTLIDAGVDRLAADGVARVFVLGDPAYYGRFGFLPDTHVAPPYPLPEEWRGAWQSRGLGDEAPRPGGALTVPPPWRVRGYWAP